VEKAGLNNMGPKCMGGNRRTGICRTKFARVEKAGLENMGT